MEQAPVVRSCRCPGCSAILAPPAPGRVMCPNCRWSGEVYFFNPRQLSVQAAEAALPEDATCATHPRKRATAVCAGTGNYICSLCAVELGGQVYSAEYLSAGGKEKAAKAFDRNLPRPDNYITTYLFCLFIPYINFILIPFAFIWIPHAFFLYFKSLRLRRENPLFARLMSKRRVVVLPILLSLVAVLWVVGVVGLTYAIMEKKN
jgi:hypothetical protein